MHDHVGRLQKKIVIVTGAFEGIGEAIARRMCDEGATVIAADDATEVRTLADGRRFDR